MGAHAQVRESLGVYALGALPRDEAAYSAAHLRECVECRTEYAELREAVDGLAVSESPAPSVRRARRMKERVMSVVRGERASSGYATIVPRDRLKQFAPGVRWAVLPGDGATTIYWIFDAGIELPAERHRHAQTGVILEGKVELEFGDGASRYLHAGDCFTIAPQTVHGGTFLERTVMVDVYSPGHETFEKLYAEGEILKDEDD